MRIEDQFYVREGKPDVGCTHPEGCTRCNWCGFLRVRVETKTEGYHVEEDRMVLTLVTTIREG